MCICVQEQCVREQCVCVCESVPCVCVCGSSVCVCLGECRSDWGRKLAGALESWRASHPEVIFGPGVCVLVWLCINKCVNCMVQFLSLSPSLSVCVCLCERECVCLCVCDLAKMPCWTD